MVGCLWRNRSWAAAAPIAATVQLPTPDSDASLFNILNIQAFAQIMGAEAALLRIQFMSGTHAIASALYGCLRPGDEMLAIAGKPYDTLEEVRAAGKSLQRFQRRVLLALPWHAIGLLPTLGSC